MKKPLLARRILYGASLMLILLVAGCGPSAATTTAPPTSPPPTAAPPTPAPPTATTAPTDVPAPELEGDLVRGGLMYDNWWKAAEVDAPTGDHPLWKTQTTNTRTGLDTWRCKECHGWDYKGVDGAYGSGSHKTGFPGIFSAKDKPAAEVLDTLKGSANPDHDFSAMLDEQALIDLALFVTQGQIDGDELINADKTAKGDASQGNEKYETTCENCHGPQGVAMNFGDFEELEFVPHIAADNPWEFLHKVRFGQPGEVMPSSIVNKWTDADLANVLAYVQTLSPEAVVSGGGLLYDKWWTQIGAAEPVGDHPLWKTQTTNTRTGLDTWRCKECHGWDYKGVDGAYGSGSHLTGFPGILGSASMSADELAAWLTGQKNADHDFSTMMGEAEIAALVTFMQKEVADTAAFINADKTVNGDPARGEVKYEDSCAACHGPDGKTLNFGSDAEPEFVGTIAVDNPWEFFHKTAFGHPAAAMPAGLALGWSWEDIANVNAYAATLPTK
jgi:thiosulfate dehydrogenase